MLLTSDGRIQQVVDRWTEASSVVLQGLSQSIFVKENWAKKQSSCFTCLDLDPYVLS